MCIILAILIKLSIRGADPQRDFLTLTLTLPLSLSLHLPCAFHWPLLPPFLLAASSQFHCSFTALLICLPPFSCAHLFAVLLFSSPPHFPSLLALLLLLSAIVVAACFTQVQFFHTHCTLCSTIVPFPLPFTLTPRYSIPPLSLSLSKLSPALQSLPLRIRPVDQTRETIASTDANNFLQNCSRQTDLTLSLSLTPLLCVCVWVFLCVCVGL